MNAISLRKVAPGWTELTPWTDKRGRFDSVRAATFAVLLIPAAWLLIRALAGSLGPEPVNAAIHSTGYAAIWLLMASLVITPLRALSGRPSIAVLRRMVGNAALLYALLHLILYMTDQRWRMATIVGEIVKRFYLTIGFGALIGLIILGVTSTDGWSQTLGRTWKRLHRIVYALAVLGLVHYLLQSKLDVSQALLAAGIFGWLMLWRSLPLGRDRTWAPLLAISAGAALLTLAAEYLWYRLGTRIDPMKVVLSETDIAFGLHPAGQVLLAGLVATVCVLLKQASATRFGAAPIFTMLIYALGALTGELVAFAMGWSQDDVTPSGFNLGGIDLLWVALLAVLGLARWKLRHHALRHLVDAVWLVCILQNLVLAGTGSRTLGEAVSGVIVGFSILLGYRIWTVSRGATLTLIPPMLLLAYEAARAL